MHSRISPDGRFVGIIGYHSMYVYDLPKPGKPRRISGSRSSGDFYGFAFHPNGRSIAVIHGGPTLVKEYTLPDLTPLRKRNWKVGPLRAIDYSPDGTMGAAGGRDGRIVVWDADD
jgi:WD40 repeat protein